MLMYFNFAPYYFYLSIKPIFFMRKEPLDNLLIYLFLDLDRIFVTGHFIV